MSGTTSFPFSAIRPESPKEEIAPEPAVPLAALSDSFIPPVIACLPELAEGAEVDSQVASATEFERRVGNAFSILGFDVERLGQGRGRLADGIARNRSGNWAIVYDAKQRGEGYRMRTDDRTFREYAEKHCSELKLEGIKNVYFCVVGSRFFESDLEKAKALVDKSDGLKSFVFLTAATLLDLVDAKLRSPTEWSDERVRKLFSETRIATL